MGKQLEKALKDAMKEKKRTLGVHQIIKSIKNSKLIILSHSVSADDAKTIQESAKNEDIQTVTFDGSSVALGRLCGLQFRVSAISLTSITDTNVKAILNEMTPE